MLLLVTTIFFACYKEERVAKTATSFDKVIAYQPVGAYSALLELHKDNWRYTFIGREEGSGFYSPESILIENMLDNKKVSFNYQDFEFFKDAWIYEIDENGGKDDFLLKISGDWNFDGSSFISLYDYQWEQEMGNRLISFDFDGTLSRPRGFFGCDDDRDGSVEYLDGDIKLFDELAYKTIKFFCEGRHILGVEEVYELVDEIKAKIEDLKGGYDDIAAAEKLAEFSKYLKNLFDLDFDFSDEDVTEMSEEETKERNEDLEKDFGETGFGTPEYTDIKYRISLLSGDEQCAAGGTTLEQPLVVQVLDGQNLPVSGFKVDFFTIPGHGTPMFKQMVTNSRGVVENRWQLGPEREEQLLLIDYPETNPLEILELSDLFKAYVLKCPTVTIASHTIGNIELNNCSGISEITGLPYERWSSFEILLKLDCNDFIPEKLPTLIFGGTNKEVSYTYSAEDSEILVTYCIKFGTSESSSLSFKLVSDNGFESVYNMTIPKPAGANVTSGESIISKY